MSLRIVDSSPLLKIIWRGLMLLPTPSSLNSNWNFGSTLGICLIVQLVTGIFLAIHYVSGVINAFDAVVHICNNVSFGWLIRSVHANGASLFFFLIYWHIGRGLYYRRYQFKPVWISGVTILFLLIATAFLGYVLPWGQISFWGATVITNLIRAVPYFGETLVYWIWGGFAVGGRTLTRFFAFHFVLPFVITGLVILHILLLHEKGSSNPIGLSYRADKIPFAPYFSIKDLVGWLLIFGGLFRVSLLSPWYLGDSENFIPANSLVTPVHIKPEWYFLFAYAILRSIPNKLGGVVRLVLSIIVLYLLPFTYNKLRSSSNRVWQKSIFWWFIRIFIILTWVGGAPVEDPYILLGQTLRVVYFVYFLILIMLY